MIPLWRRRLHWYRYTWLTRPIGWTTDREKVRRARAIYGDEAEYGNPGWWTTSRLGILNGWLSLVGLKVYGHVASEPWPRKGIDGAEYDYRVITGYSLGRAEARK